MVRSSVRFSKLPKQQQMELREAVLLLRFRCTRPTSASRKHAAYGTIAQVLQLTCNQVQHICRKALNPDRPIKPER